MATFAMGDPLDEATYLGPMCMPSAPAALQAQVDDALAKGAKLVLGGDRAAVPTDRFYPPTVLTDVTHDMAVMKEESFGPVIGIQRVRSDDEAVALMNDSDFGLTAGVFSTDEQRARGVLSRVSRRRRRRSHAGRFRVGGSARRGRGVRSRRSQVGRFQWFVVGRRGLASVTVTVPVTRRQHR